MTALPYPRPRMSPPTDAPRLRLADVPAAAAETFFARLLLGWLAVRTGAWTLLAWLQPNPALDTVEWLVWGQRWQLGYHKHPPLAAWVAEIAGHLTPGSFLGLYLVGYLALAAALVAVWLVAREWLPPREAFAAVVALDGLSYLGSYGCEYNNQVLLIAFWALTITFFYRGCARERWTDWLAAGLMAGLALLCKYSTVTLLLPLLAWRVWTTGFRRWVGPALMLVVAGAVFAPHLLWLRAHDFPTLRYAADRLAGDGEAPRLGASAVEFATSQLTRLLPALLILLPVLRWRWRAVDEAQARARSLLLWAIGGPVAVTLALSVLGGTQFRGIWGAPLWTFVPLAVILCLTTDDAPRRWRWLAGAWAVVMVAFLAATLVVDLHGSGLKRRATRIHYPGAALAAETTGRYRERYGCDPAVVAGDWWLAGNVGCHAASRPVLYGSREPSSTDADPRRRRGDPHKYAAPDPRACPWTDDEQFRRRGGLLLWSVDFYGETLPAWLAERFPEAEGQPPLHLPFLGGSRDTLAVGWAMLPPADR